MVKGYQRWHHRLLGFLDKVVICVRNLSVLSTLSIKTFLLVLLEVLLNFGPVTALLITRQPLLGYQGLGIGKPYIAQSLVHSIIVEQTELIVKGLKKGVVFVWRISLDGACRWNRI